MATTSDKLTAAKLTQLRSGHTNYITNKPFSTKCRQIFDKTRLLPLTTHMDKVLDTFYTARVAIYSSDPGSGKTTQISQAVAHAARHRKGLVAVTEPRKVAAIEMADRVAAEMDVQLGGHVGYQVRFDKKTSASTKLVFLTEGILVNEALQDEKLSRYDAIILDEVHERSIDTDILLGLVLQLLKRRQDIKIVIMSATLNIAKLMRFFGTTAKHLHVPGHAYDVQTKFLTKNSADVLDDVVHTVHGIHMRTQPGHILVFLPGEDEIEMVCAKLRKHCTGLSVFPLYGMVGRTGQASALRDTPEGVRKCVVATNLAETSVTIDGVVFVVDSGLCKHMAYNTRLGMQELSTESISRASADQRRGRAGRTKSGYCYRMYTEKQYNKMLADSLPAIVCDPIFDIFLRLKAAGCTNILDFPWLDPPPPESIARAYEDAMNLNLVEPDGSLTWQGELAKHFPASAIWLRALGKASNEKCSAEMLDIVAIFSAQRSIFFQHSGPKIPSLFGQSQWADPLSDHVTALKAFHAYVREKRRRTIEDLAQWCLDHFLRQDALEEAMSIRSDIFTRFLTQDEKLEHGIEYHSSNDDNYVQLRKALALGFPHQIACLSLGNPPSLGCVDEYRTVWENVPCLISAESVVEHVGESEDEQFHHQWVVYTRFNKLRHPVLSAVTVIQPEWLVDEPFFAAENMKRGEDGKLLMPDAWKSLQDARKQ